MSSTAIRALEHLTEVQRRTARAYQDQHGGDLLGALEATLGPEEVAHVWSDMAMCCGWEFFPDHRSLRSIEGHLIDRRVALHLGVTPHRQEYTACCVVTSDPDVPLAPIHAALGQDVKLHLVPPAVYDRVTQLAYPSALWGNLTDAEALALATSRHIALYQGKTVQRCLEEKLITHDQAARAHATLLHLPYADVRRTPPDPALLSLLPAETQRHLQVYPYQLIDGVLTVLMERPDSSALRLLTMTMQREVRPVITAATTMQDLLKEDSSESESPVGTREPLLARS